MRLIKNCIYSTFKEEIFILKKLLLRKAVVVWALSSISFMAYSQSEPFQGPWPNEVFIKGVIRSENEELKSNDQTDLPNPPDNIGPKMDKELAAKRVALALLCREWKKKKRGTAPPKPLPTENELKYRPIKHSAEIAEEQTREAINVFNDMTDTEKQEFCVDGGGSYFWHQCFKKTEGNVFVRDKPWPVADWVKRLRANPSTYLCIPYGSNYFYVNNGDKYCKFCFPIVKVK